LAEDISQLGSKLIIEEIAMEVKRGE